MIVVRVELHSAITHRISEIARFDIWNIGGTQAKGDYKCAAFRGRSREALAKRVAQRTGSIKNHPRLSSHVLNLAAKALASMGYK